MKTISLPRSPFFCAPDGRYLPGLTGLIVEAAAMLQRIEIEEQLFKLHLKQKCFQALAAQCPQSTVHSPQSELDAPRLTIMDFPAVGSDQVAQGGGNAPSASPAVTQSPVSILAGGIQGEELKRLEGHTHPLPARSTDQVATSQFLQSSSAKASIKVFPLAPISTRETSNFRPGEGATESRPVFGFYPKGRW